MTDRWLTLREAAPLLRVCEETLRRRAQQTGYLDRDRQIPVANIGTAGRAMWRVPAGALSGEREADRG